MKPIIVNKKSALIFLVGLFSMTQIRVIGAFPLCEMITIPIGLFLLLKLPNYFADKRFKTVFLLCLFWLLGAFISDLYNGSQTVDMLKGLGTVVIFLLNILFSYWALKDNYYRLIWFLIGAFLSAFLQLFLFPNMNFREALLESGISGVWETWSIYFIAPIVSIFAFRYYASHRKWIILFIFLYGIYSVFNMSRNQFLIYSLVSLLLVAIGSVSDYKEGVIKQFILQRKAFRYFVLMLLGLFIVQGSYEYLATKGYLGEAAQRKYEMQAIESDLGILSGRSEVWMGLYAVKDSPLLGFGSFAKDNGTHALLFLERFDPNNTAAYNFRLHRTEIPAHSHIVGAWVWHGISGLLFWLYILYLILLFLWKYVMKDPPLIAFSLLMTFSFLWNIFFSPFNDRIGEAMSISFILLSMRFIGTLNNKLSLLLPTD